MNKDSEFLYWIAKRLVYKYGESKEILSIVNSIINKYELLTNYSKSLHQNMNDEVEKIQIICQKILQKKHNETCVVKQNIADMRHNIVMSSFENIDIDAILKN